MYNLYPAAPASDQKLLFAAPVAVPRKPKHVLASADLSREEIRLILDAAVAMKRQRASNPCPIYPVEGRVLAMIFEKQSLRTRVTFETAMHELGGHAIYLTKADIDMGRREAIEDVARNLARWSRMIVARLNSHDTLVQLARHSAVPVLNALTDLEHPCQALADVLTVEERFGRRRLKLAWVGDGNNVANSFAVTAAKLGHDVAICSPPGYEAADYVYQMPGVSHFYKPEDGVEGADAVYTDVWVSMGQEAEEEARVARFARFQVNGALMSKASPGAVFLHCLPARRGLEVTDEVIDGPQSLVYDQAENRLHGQKALMKLILDGVIA